MPTPTPAPDPSATRLAFGDTICKCEGENDIVCPNIKRSFTRRYGGIAASFVNLETLAERLKLAQVARHA